MTEVGADPPAEVAAAVEGAGDEVKEDDEKASEVTSEKITSVLEAANALTSLGDEEEEGESRKADSKEIVKEEKEETKEKVEDESEVKDEKSEPILEAVKPPATVELNTVKDPPELPVEPPDEEKPPLKEEAIAGEVPGPGSLPKDDTPPKEEIEEDDAAASKRYLPEHKKPDAAPTFPEKASHHWRYHQSFFRRRNCTTFYC